MNRHRANAPRTLVLALVAALSGCGGGGGSASAPPAPSATAPPQPDGSFVANGTNTATLTLRFPLRSSTASVKRAPAYVSPSSTQIVVAITAYNGSASLPSYVPATTTVALTTTGSAPNCSIASAIETCAVTVPAPPGTVGYSFTVEDGSGTALATLATTLTIAQGQTNASLSITLEGIAASFVLTPPSLNANTVISAPGSGIAFAASDADGNPIGGSANFANPIALTDNDTSGATTLSVNGGTAATAVVVAKPTDVVTIQYSGLAIVPFTIGWSGTGIAASSASVATSWHAIGFSGTTLDATVSDVNYNQPTLSFYTLTAAAQTLTISESGWSNAPYDESFGYTLDPSTCGTGAAAVATVSPASGSASAYSATPQHNGVCKITVSDFPGGQTAVAWIAVTSSSFGISSKGRVK